MNKLVQDLENLSIETKKMAVETDLASTEEEEEEGDLNIEDETGDLDESADGDAVPMVKVRHLVFCKR